MRIQCLYVCLPPPLSNKLSSFSNTFSFIRMKPENLTTASYIEQAQAQFQQLTKDPRVRQQLQQWQQRLPPGVQWTHVAGGSAILFIGLIYFLGFSRTMMLVSFTLLLLMMIGPDLASGVPSSQIIKNLPMRFRSIVQEQMPGGRTIANNNYMLVGLAILILLFFGKALLTNPNRKAASSGSSAMNFINDAIPSRTSSSSSRTLLNVKTMEDFYKLGFEDAQAEKEYGTSLEVEKTRILKQQQQQQTTEDDLYSSTSTDYLPPPPSQQQSLTSKVLSISNTMSMMYIGRTLMDLGRNADGSWSFELMKQNIVTLEPWKLGLMGFSIYRIISAIFF